MDVKPTGLIVAALLMTLALASLLVFGSGVRIARAEASPDCTVCYLPDNEEAFPVGQSADLYKFQMHIWPNDNPSGSMNGRLVEEDPGGNVSDTCWWSGNTYFGPYPTFNGQWTVGEGSEAGNTNYWGYDSMGFTEVQVAYIQEYGPAHGVPSPCTMTAYQAMSIEYCSGDSFYSYDSSPGNEITFKVYKTDSSPGQVICRKEGIPLNNEACGDIDY
jgi:hypothetical protein